MPTPFAFLRCRSRSIDRGGEQEGPALAWQLDEEDWAMMVTSWRDDGGVDDQRFPPKRMGAWVSSPLSSILNEKTLTSSGY